MKLPFSRTSAPDDLLSLAREYDALRSSCSERLTRFEQYHTEQLGVRSNTALEGEADLRDYNRRPGTGAQGQPKRHKIHLPLGKAMTVKHAFRISGQLPDVVVDQRDATKAEAHRSASMEKVVWSIIRHSKGNTALSSAAWDSSEVGAACFDLYWDVKAQTPTFRRVNPAGVIEVQGMDDPHDFERVYRTWDAPLAAVAAQYRNGNFREQRVEVEHLSAHHNVAGQEVVRIVQVADKSKVTRFAQGASNGEIVGLYEFQHNYGFTPYIIIPNLGPYEDVWGWADYEFVRSLVHYLPLLFSREADVLKSVANGGQIEKGTGATPQDVAKVQREGGVLPSKRDGSVEPIQAPEMPSFHERHSERGMEFLKMLGFTPDASWGLGSAGSGSDRGLQLQPMLEYTAMKQLNWSAGLSRLFGLAFQMVEKHMVGTNTYRGSVPGKGGRKLPFAMQIGPDVEAIETTAGEDGLGMPIPVTLPRTPKELFDGDYDVRFVWRIRVDPDDPQYVMSETNLFKSGLQSMETTLENLGCQTPEDEMKRIEAEAQRFPWVNQGLVSLLMAQIRGNAQGSGGGASFDQGGAIDGALETMTGGGGGASGALNADAATAAAGGSGPMYGGA